MMKIARLLCALWVCGVWVCGPPALDARAADLPARSGAAAAPAKAPLPHATTARARAVPTPNRHGGPIVAAGGKASARGAGFPGASSHAPAGAVATGAGRVVPGVTPMLRSSAFGGPRAAPGRVGGPASSRTTHNGTISGTQLHHKF
jgi:hypothetical protein